jgi:hypothetical protein
MNIKLINSKITEIKAKRNTEFSGKLELKSNINIKSVEKIKEAKDILRIEYIFNINYSELGKITIEGLLFLKGDKDTINNIIKKQEEKDYDSEEFIFIMNTVMQKASLKALQLEEELDLPIHIKLPSFSKKK